MMNGVNHFSGGVVIHSLPCLTPGEGVEMPALKRLLLPQGELAQFHDSALGIHYLAALELAGDGVRGNHFHRVKVEHLYVMRGEVELLAQGVDSGERGQWILRAGDLVIVQPGIAHAYRTRQPGIAIEFAPTRFDPADIHRYAVG